MKKILSFIAIILVMTACTISKDADNTPRKQVEAYLDSYQKLDSNILNDLDTMIKDTEYNESQKMRYNELMKKHYSSLKYEILKETIDKDKAMVDVDIEVNDYSKILSEDLNQDDYKDEEGNYDVSKYLDAQLDKLEKATERTKYTVTFYLTKKNNEWIIDDLDKTTIKKIHGIYIQ